MEHDRLRNVGAAAAAPIEAEPAIGGGGVPIEEAEVAAAGAPPVETVLVQERLWNVDTQTFADDVVLVFNLAASLRGNFENSFLIAPELVSLEVTETMNNLRGKKKTARTPLLKILWKMKFPARDPITGRILYEPDTDPPEVVLTNAMERLGGQSQWDFFTRVMAAMSESPTLSVYVDPTNKSNWTTAQDGVVVPNYELDRNDNQIFLRTADFRVLPQLKDNLMKTTQPQQMEVYHAKLALAAMTGTNQAVKNLKLLLLPSLANGFQFTANGRVCNGPQPPCYWDDYLNRQSMRALAERTGQANRVRLLLRQFAEQRQQRQQQQQQEDLLPPRPPTPPLLLDEEQDDDDYESGDNALFADGDDDAEAGNNNNDLDITAVVSKVQALTRRFLARRRFVIQRNATTTIQVQTRGFLVRLYFVKCNAAALIIQVQTRDFLSRLAYTRKLNATVIIQGIIRIFLAGRRLQEMIHQRNTAAATMVQGQVRVFLSRRLLQELIHNRNTAAATMVQGRVRVFLSRRLLQELIHKRNTEAATIIQSNGRGFLARRRLVELQATTPLTVTANANSVVVMPTNDPSAAAPEFDVYYLLLNDFIQPQTDQDIVGNPSIQFDWQLRRILRVNDRLRRHPEVDIYESWMTEYGVYYSPLVLFDDGMTL